MMKKAAGTNKNSPPRVRRKIVTGGRAVLLKKLEIDTARQTNQSKWIETVFAQPEPLAYDLGDVLLENVLSAAGF